MQPEIYNGTTHGVYHPGAGDAHTKNRISSSNFKVNEGNLNYPRTAFDDNGLFRPSLMQIQAKDPDVAMLDSVINASDGADEWRCTPDQPGTNRKILNEFRASASVYKKASAETQEGWQLLADQNADITRGTCVAVSKQVGN